MLIARLLLTNPHLTRGASSSKPILFICQTNHALDQMLEHVYKTESNMIRIGSRSQSMTMQSLSLRARGNELRSKGIRFSARTAEECGAIDRMKISLAALRATLAQRSIVVSSDQNVAVFPNSTLARLRHLLNTLGRGIGNVVLNELFRRCHNDVLIAAWKSCADAAVALAKSNNENPPGWSLDYGIWLALPIDRRLMLMATFTPGPSNPFQGRSIADYWMLSGPKKKKRKQGRATDEWQTVGASEEGDDTDDDDVGDRTITFPLARSFAAHANSGEVEIGGIDEVDRTLDDAYDFDDDGEYAFAMQLSTFNQRMTSKLEREEEMVAQIIGRESKSVPPHELLDSLRRANDLWGLSKSDRQALSSLWADLLNADAKADVSRYTADYNKAAKIDQKYRAVEDAMILRHAAVIGMTTNGAAKYSVMLRELGPEVIIVEEAAEVLEASIVASFTTKTKHVILIGDHKQLRPQVQEHNIATHYGLEVSLFERLVRLGLPHVTLTTQRRMHPEISSLITPAIYERLENAPSVSEYPLVAGVRDRVFFISHTEPEDGQATAWGASVDQTGAGVKRMEGVLQGAEMSKTNTHEAKFLLRLLQYLILNGYQPEQLVVLTMYKGQLNLLRRLSKEKEFQISSVINVEALDKVRMTTTDNYQGEESDIVLGSLVRSNAGEGAMKKDRRIS